MKKAFIFANLFLLMATAPLFAKAQMYVGAYEQNLMPEHAYRPPKPFMWNARLKVDRSFTAGYERMIYAYKNHLELYTGLSGNYLETWRVRTDHIFAVSTYLMAKLYLVRMPNFNLSILYSPAGPSFITKRHFATTRFSNHFVFQNQLGIAMSFAKDAETEFFIKQYHYSNGDFFPVNGGIDVPLLLGFSFSL